MEHRDGEVTVIALRGEHDLQTAPDLRDALAASRAAGDSLVVDLSATTFVDSSILGLLVDARERALEDGRRFALALDGAAADPVRRVLDVTGLTSELPVHESLKDALEAARGDREG